MRLVWVEAAASAAILPVIQAVLGLRAGQGQLAAGRADVHLPGVRAGHRPGSQRGQESGPACLSWCMGRREFLGDLGKRLSSGQSWPDRQRPGETACGKAGTDSHPRRHAHRCVDSDERFNSLQVGAERPPALKAVIAIYASDDRYTDDVHYTGGAVKLLDLVDYPLYMVALNALPPVPAIAGVDWRERWRERVEGLEPWLLRWLEEQVDGPYWRQGSLRPGYEQIACPTMLVAGWADGYRNATFRLLEQLEAPVRLLFGPWSHMATDISLPGPRIDLVPEMVRWWDRWLRGERNGVDEGPPVTVFVRHPTRPAPDLDEHLGVWRDEPAWPPARATTRTLRLGEAVAGPGVARPTGDPAAASG